MMNAKDSGRVLVLWLPEIGCKAPEKELQELLLTTPLRLVQPARGMDCLKQLPRLLQGITSILLPLMPQTVFLQLQAGNYHDPVLQLLLLARQQGIPVRAWNFWPGGPLPEPVTQCILAEKKLLETYGITVLGAEKTVPQSASAAPKVRVITEELLRREGATFVWQPGDIVTPLARDYARQQGLRLTPQQK